MPDGRLLEVGRIVRAHGLRGQLAVDLWSPRRERLAAGSRLTTPRGELVVREAHPHGPLFLVSFEGIERREDAESWRGVVLSAPEAGDGDDDTIWVDDLFGAAVYDQDGQHRGLVVGVEANPASDLLVLDDGTLVPLHFVTRVAAHERVDVDVPEGIFP